MKTIKVAGRFYSDHLDRGLPTPKAVRWLKHSVEIETDDKEAMLELLNDARYYADPYGPDSEYSVKVLKPSAKRVIAAIERAMKEGAC